MYDSDRWDFVFHVFCDRGQSLLHPAVLDAVEEVDEQTDDEPDQQSQPSAADDEFRLAADHLNLERRQAEHHGSADNDPEDRDERHPWCLEGPRQLRMRLA